MCIGSSLSSNDVIHDTAGAVTMVIDDSDSLCDVLISEKQTITASLYGTQSH